MNVSTKPSWRGTTKENFLKYFRLEPRSNSYGHWLIIYDNKTNKPLRMPGSNREYLKYNCSDDAVNDVIKMIKEGKIKLQWD